MIEFRGGGWRVSQNEFLQNLQNDIVASAMKELGQRIHAAAASIVDPKTGKYAEVFVRRGGPTQLILRTRGSSAFARELERRLDMTPGSIQSGAAPVPGVPHLYLAYASEDKETLARPLAQTLIDKGIEVWFDEWEIRTGDSLRRKMEEGLGSCTHFLALLTPRSLHKPRVQAEIDVGFVRAIGKVSRFMGLRVGVDLKALSPFLQTLHCPEVDLGSEATVQALIADIHGVSRKPEPGAAPRYIKTQPEGVKGWSPSAVAVAEHLVRTSKFGRKFDPQVRVSTVAQATGLPEEDVRLGMLDLEGAGLVERSPERGADTRFWATTRLFVEFDQHFLDFTPRDDALSVANWLLNQNLTAIDVKDLAPQFPDWPPRRLNSALNYLEDAKLIQPLKAFGSDPWVMVFFRITDHTRRFVRDNS